MKSKRWARWLLVLLLAVSSAMLLSGCGGGDDDDDAAPAAGADGADGADGAAGADGADGADGTDGADGADGADGTAAAEEDNVDIAGVWNGTRSSDAGSTSLQFFFEQAANGNLTGDYHDTSGFEGTIQGEISGDDIQFHVHLTAGAPGDTWTFTGAANAAGTQMTGNMNVGGAVHNIQAHR